MTNRFLDIGIGSLDLEDVQGTFCEPRKSAWWRSARPAIIVVYGDSNESEFEFLFDYGEEVKRDAEHRRIVEALNRYSNGSESKQGSS